MKTNSFFVFSLIICMYFQGQPVLSQNLHRKERFNRILNANNLTFSLPKRYAEVDTALIKKNFSFFVLRYVNDCQIESTSGNVMIFTVFLEYSKSDEDKIKRLYPNRNIDLKNDHLNIIRKLISENNKQFKDTISFNEKDIYFYSNKCLKSLGADIAGDYTMKLASPYLGEYNYVTYRFIGRNYKMWIHTYIFYKVYNPNTAKKTLKETLFLFKIKN